MLIDTHCHLDAAEFAADRAAVIERAGEQGVGAIVIPAVSRANLDTVRDLAHSFRGGCYALGIHPICVPDAQDSDLDVLESCIVASLDDSRFVAIGEIGLDFFLPRLKEPEMRAKQEMFYRAQLELAQRYGLPVILHVRRSQDILLKHLRACKPIGGIGHAFNGSFQQAQQFIEHGFALGFGGAMTFPRALQIRRLAAQLPLEALVLETDAPDIPPAWLGEPGKSTARNEPAEVAGIATHMAQLRGLTRMDMIQATAANARRVMPRLSAALKS
ncbi:TatD family hydrolase [Pollutimonas harenae]|uniref:TatD family hydrolase n=1 Tax=Pollutimonas harenae TaxID=657015 RepID=A0A853H7Z3_9BURK|nr:TatD family hydrolase [Pollutimonas harenae]NYT86194.1 TatD family hydrolase [Pollutimonas harenae]TEA71227.1 TatD family deoxyribonuclease [Pollutimonas harenae]